MSAFVDGPVLGIETSGSLTGAALLRGGRLVGELALDNRAGSSELLLDLVQRLLACHALCPGDLARVGLALGPGSFTGVRVGLAAGRALAWAAGRPVVGVPSHEALAWPWRDLDAPLVLLTGLRRGWVYLEAGRWEVDQWRPLLPARNLEVAEVEPMLAPHLRGGLLFLGESVESVLQVCPRLAEAGRILRDPLGQTRRPAPVAFMAARTAARELSGPELIRMEPLYLRGADARRPVLTGRRRG